MGESWYDKLDDVLKTLESNKDKEFIIKNHLIEIFKGKYQEPDLMIIIDFLVIEDCVSKCPRDTVSNGTGDSDKYKLSLKGFLFIENGLYKQKNKDIILNRDTQQADLKRRNRNDLLLVRGTISAAVVASLLLIWEIWKYFQENCPFCH